MFRAPVLFLVSGVLPLSAASFMADFNTAGQLGFAFSSGQSGPASQGALVGLGNSGGVDLTGISSEAQQIFTLKQGFAGNTASWSASLFFHGGTANSVVLGLVTDPAPAIVDGTPSNSGGYASFISLQSGEADGGSVGIASYVQSTQTNTNSPNSPVAGGVSPIVAWYQYMMDVNYLGSSNYQITATLKAADANGTLGATLSTNTFTMTNPDLASDPSVHIFFHVYSGQAIDNFFTTAVPEPGAVVLAGMGILAGILRRRR